MSIAYRFEIQHSFNVVIEDDSNAPLSIEAARQFVVTNLREYVDAADLSEYCISNGVKI